MVWYSVPVRWVDFPSIDIHSDQPSLSYIRWIYLRRNLIPDKQSLNCCLLSSSTMASLKSTLWSTSISSGDIVNFFFHTVFPLESTESSLGSDTGSHHVHCQLCLKLFHKMFQLWDHWDLYQGSWKHSIYPFELNLLHRDIYNFE